MYAYNKLYLEDSIELAEQLFYEVAKEDKWDFEKFTEGFMKCEFRQIWDEGSARVINMTWDELLEYLQVRCKDIFVETNEKSIVDPLLALWIGGMYTRVQFYSAKSSEEIYHKLPLLKMIDLFRPLHTVDEEVATEKLLNWL